jgi:hypothetical protein
MVFKGHEHKDAGSLNSAVDGKVKSVGSVLEYAVFEAQN